jgi:purine-nucleoside phosphorylase
MLTVVWKCTLLRARGGCGELGQDIQLVEVFVALRTCNQTRYKKSKEEERLQHACLHLDQERKVVTQSPWDLSSFRSTDVISTLAFHVIHEAELFFILVSNFNSQIELDNKMSAPIL